MAQGSTSTTPWPTAFTPQLAHPVIFNGLDPPLHSLTPMDFTFNKFMSQEKFQRGDQSPSILFF